MIGRSRIPDLERVLCRHPERHSQGTVRRHYLAWRETQGTPVYCDNPDCSLHVSGATWNGKPITLILDHTDGNRCDDRPQNLRLLCPNCSAQLPTHGGGNKGRVTILKDLGYEAKRDDGLIDSVYFVPVAEATGDALPAEAVSVDDSSDS